MDNNNFLVSIILPGWNEGENILKCITHLEKQSYQNFNVYMILGGEDSYIEKIMQNQWNKLIVIDQIEPSKNKALNLALNHPDIGEILIFSDIDCEFPSDFIKKYVDQFQDLEKNVIAGRVQPFHSKENLLERYLRNNEERRMEDLPDKGAFLTGANFGVRLKFFSQKIKQFDENIKSSTDAGFICTLKEIHEPIYLDSENIIYSEFFVNDVKNFIKQRSRWFRNVLLYSRDFHSKRSLYIHLILALISWLLFIFIPLGYIIVNFVLKWKIISLLLLSAWIILVLIMWLRRFKDLNRNEQKIKNIIQNIMGGFVLVFLIAYINLIGSFKAIFSRNKKKSWK